MKFDKALSCLNAAISAWEDSCLTNTLLHAFCTRRGQQPPFPCEGPLISWPQFRPYLVGASNHVWNQRDFEGVGAIREALGGMHSLPYDLWLWANTGARIITVPMAASQQKMATVPEELVWQKHPLHELGSVMVVIEPPIVDEEKYEYGCFLLSLSPHAQTQGQYNIRTRLIEDNILNYTPLTSDQRRQLQELLSEQQYNKMLSQLRIGIEARQKIRLPFAALKPLEKVGFHELLLDQPSKIPANAQNDLVDVRPKIGKLSQALRIGIAVSCNCEQKDFTPLTVKTDVVVQKILLHAL